MNCGKIYDYFGLIIEYAKEGQENATQNNLSNIIRKLRYIEETIPEIKTEIEN